MTLSIAEAYDFLIRQNLAVMSTVAEQGIPEAALINYGVTQHLELVFETLQTSRKYRNLYRNPNVAIVAGFQNPCLTCQYEGTVGRPHDRELPSLLEIYFAARPEGLKHRDWPDLVYLCVKPSWIRISNYDRLNWNVKELDLRSRSIEADDVVATLPLLAPPQ